MQGQATSQCPLPLWAPAELALLPSIPSVPEPCSGLLLSATKLQQAVAYLSSPTPQREPCEGTVWAPSADP